MVNDRLTGDRMSVVSLRGSAFASSDQGAVRGDDDAQLLTPNGVCARTGESYAKLIKRHGIVNFVFSYSSGTFHALNASGEELAKGETIRELLESL